MEVSICMITYNHEKFIAQAIESVIMQKTSFKIKLVIGEDCGTDNTRKICENYEKQYPDIIRLLPSNKNLGIVPNFLRTIKACRGSYIAFCEGDDYWIDEFKLQKQVDFLESNLDYVICATDYSTVLDGLIIKENAYSLSHGKKNFDEVLNTNQFATPTVCIRTSSLKEIDFNLLRDYKIGDWPLWLSLMQYGKGMVLPDVTTAYREHDQGAFSLIPYHQKLKTTILTVSKFVDTNKFVTTKEFDINFKNNVWTVLFSTHKSTERISILNQVMPNLKLSFFTEILLKMSVALPHGLYTRLGWRILNTSNI